MTVTTSSAGAGAACSPSAVRHAGFQSALRVLLGVAPSRLMQAVHLVAPTPIKHAPSPRESVRARIG